MSKGLKSHLKCTGCVACVNVCGVGAIEVVADKDGFRYPKIDTDKCVNCHRCEEVCHANLTGNAPKKAVACYNTDSEKRKNSSSGGIFSLLAENILSRGGAVYGAVFGEDFSVCHSRVDSADSLPRLLGSKYVQSDIGFTYREVKKDLREGRAVLYSGTPCQIFGLKAYLGKEYENLFTVEVICHGVPSPLVWKNYLDAVRENLGEDVTKVNFRDKSSGWQKYSLGIYGREKSAVETCNDNLYIRVFLGNFILRESCYRCDFRDFERNADITLGDLWGSESICPELHSDNGLSVAIINTDKGERIFDEISDLTVKREVSLGDVIRVNKSFLVSPYRPKSRNNIDGFTKVHPSKWKINTSRLDKIGSFIKRAYNKVAVETELKKRR